MNNMTNNQPAPVVLFVYNRPWHTRQTVEALQRNELTKESDLFIFSDGPKDNAQEKKVGEVRKYIRTIDGFKKIIIIEREHNLSLAKSIIRGVTDVITKYGKVIVMEDDLVSSPYFLNFMNEALNFYENEEKVLSIQGYIFPIKGDLPELFFLKCAGCWGWATWKRGWDLFERDGKKLLDQLRKYDFTREFDFNHTYKYTELLKGQVNGKGETWAVPWYASVFLHGGLSLFPGRSLIRHIGNDGSGTNFGKCNMLDVEIADRPINLKIIPIEENQWMRKEFARYFKSIKPSLPRRIAYKIIDFVNEYTRG